MAGQNPNFNDSGERIQIGVSFSDGATPETDETWNAPENKSNAQPKTKTKVLIDQVKGATVFNIAKQGVSSGLNRIGTYTGNYVLQNQINTTASMIGLGTSIITGIATGNYALLAMQVVQIGIAQVDLAVGYMKADRQSDIMNQIKNISATSKSRGGGKYV